MKECAILIPVIALYAAVIQMFDAVLELLEISFVTSLFKHLKRKVIDRRIVIRRIRNALRHRDIGIVVFGMY